MGRDGGWRKRVLRIIRESASEMRGESYGVGYLVREPPSKVPMYTDVRVLGL